MLLPLRTVVADVVPPSPVTISPGVAAPDAEPTSSCAGLPLLSHARTVMGFSRATVSLMTGVKLYASYT